MTPAGSGCPAADPNRPARGTLTVQGDRVGFAPDDGALVIHGTIAPDGTVTARRDEPGANGKPYPMGLQAKQQGDSVAGTFTTPRCQYNVALTRVHTPPFEGVLQ
jgi:hypothetical protein